MFTTVISVVAIPPLHICYTFSCACSGICMLPLLWRNLRAYPLWKFDCWQFSSVQIVIYSMASLTHPVQPSAMFLWSEFLLRLLIGLHFKPWVNNRADFRHSGRRKRRRRRRSTIMRKLKNLENKKDKNGMEEKKGKWRDGAELKRIWQRRKAGNRYIQKKRWKIWNCTRRCMKRMLKSK